MTEEQQPETNLPQPGTPVRPPPVQLPATYLRRRPSIVLLVVVAGISLAADLLTKWWALTRLERVLPSGETIAASKEVTAWFSFVLARNRGGAWGLLQGADDHVRKPFFLLISLLAILFIVSLYRRVHPQQHALKWGLPLVLGGALGNLVDRIRYSWVIDFIDMRGVWVRYLNEWLAKIWHQHAVTDHWPTYNVADIAICIGVGLMAIDMFTSRKGSHVVEALAPAPASVAPAADAPTPPQASPPPAGPSV